MRLLQRLQRIGLRGVFKDLTQIFLSDFGVFLGRKRNRFLVRRKGEQSEVVADDVDSIVFCTSGAGVSTSALDLAIRNGIQVVLARYGGWPYGILMPTSMTGSVRARREQFLAYNDKRGFILSRGFVLGKLSNQASILKLMAKNRKQTDPVLADKLYRAGREIDRIASSVSEREFKTIDEGRQTLMNLEAEAAREYWQAVKQVLPAELGFEGRVTRGAKDPFNAMLNFGYQTVLFPEAWKAVTYAGLDPYAGFLHADRPGKPSLVLDVMEEFRQQTVDRTLIALIARNMIKPDEVLSKDKREGTTLSPETLKLLLTSLQERLGTEVMFSGQRAPIRSLIHLQVRRAVRLLLGESDYEPFSLGW
jgi:CRISPR-associated protein Cas1